MSDISQLVLYEDNHIIVALKPPRMLSQGDETGDPDLLSLLKGYVKEKYNKPGEAYLGLVHRMDRPVGGLLVFARTSKAAARLSEQIKNDTLAREYVLVCEGKTPARFTLKDYLVKDAKNNMVRVLPQHLKLQGKEAILHGQTIAFTDEKSLVAIRLQTGRAHQIRAQMAHAGHPLLGDARYNPDGAKGLIALWGMRLSLNHPITGKAMVFVCAPGKMPGGYPHSTHFDAYQRDLDTLERLWPDIAP
ncbi:MAG: RluA family pseudouridine synthase [Clostridiales bacterium]|nr:RluA family pseudouridine synthase [Clostridiales bacterium]